MYFPRKENLFFVKGNYSHEGYLFFVVLDYILTYSCFICHACYFLNNFFPLYVD